MARWGLRGKSLFALASTSVFALLMIAMIGWYFVQKGQEYSAENYADSFTELNYQRMLTPVSRELALAQRFANSPIVKAWLRKPDDPALKELWLEETQSYLNAFQSHNMFLVNDKTKQYFFADPNSPLSTTPKYVLEASKPADSWYFLTRQQHVPFVINVNYDSVLKVIKVWIDVDIVDHGQFLGVAGTGLSLEHFIKQFADNAIPGVTPFIINANGSIQIHHNEKMIAYNSMNGKDKQHSIYALLDNDKSREKVKAALQKARHDKEKVVTIKVDQGGHQQLMAFVYFPLLDWYVVTNIDLNKVSLFNSNLVLPTLGVLVLLLILLLGFFGLVIERLVITPIRELQQSAKSIAGGSYDVSLVSRSNDEIGDLSKTFNTMAQQVRNHTQELEKQVQKRTAELEEAHQKVVDAHRKMGASIDYASLIQKSILPDRQMRQFLGDQHSVIWRPRDVVGGDFYVFHNTNEGCLLGIVDCAGHGVPGALMTMLMRAAIDYAIGHVGIQNPAALLSSIDTTLRSMLNEELSANKVATNADVGLVYVPNQGDFIRFSGAKITLYGSNGDDIIKQKSGRRALGDRRVGEYNNTELPMSGWTYYMTTDGFLDQAGGEKNFGFGNQRFEGLIKDNAALPLRDQADFFESALDDYMGDQPQRDDITLLSFRFDPKTQNNEV